MGARRRRGAEGARKRAGRRELPAGPPRGVGECPDGSPRPARLPRCRSSEEETGLSASAHCT